MKTRILLLFFLGLLLLGAIFLREAPAWMPAEPPPEPDKAMQRRCDVQRDTWDVPHVTAPSKEALMYCFGHVQALDRAWQLDYLRRVALGRMAERYGFDYVRQDFFLRLLDLAGHAERQAENLRKQTPAIHALLRYYVWGINDGFAKLQRGEATAPYQAQGRKPSFAPWRLSHTFAIVLLQGFFQTNRTFLQDAEHQRLREALKETRFQDLFGSHGGPLPFDVTIVKPGEHPLTAASPASLPPSPSSRPTAPFQNSPQAPSSLPTSPALRRGASQFKGTPRRRFASQAKKSRTAKRRRFASSPWPAKRKTTALFRWREIRSWLPKEMQKTQDTGSNSWVIGPKRSASGYALFANDPHLAVTTPSFWHEIHLKGPGIDAMGVGVPGTPAITSGHNRSVAWGITNGYTNVADLVAFVPTAANHLQLQEKAYPLRPVRPTVWFRAGPFVWPVFWQKFETTDLGPILPMRWPGKEGQPSKKILLRWSGLSMTLPPIETALRLLEAKDAKDADEALKLWQLPCFNFVFADTKGQIGYRQVGLMPRRHRGKRGLTDASDAKAQWDGFLRPEEQPAVFQPSRGFVVTANNRAFPTNVPFYLGDHYQTAHRAKRIEDLLQAKTKHTLEDLQAIQIDLLSPDAVILLPLMLERLAPALSKAPSDPTLPKIVAILRAWDRKASKTQVAPTIFRAWLERVFQELFSKDKVKGTTYAVLRILEGKLAKGTDQALEDVLLKTLIEASQAIASHLGPDIETWLWGRYHQIWIASLLATPEAKNWRPDPQPLDGDRETVLPSGFEGPGPWKNLYTASWRLLVELGPVIRSFGVLAGKQIDEEPRKLSFQQTLWLNLKLRPRPFSPAEIQKAEKSKITISF